MTDVCEPPEVDWKVLVIDDQPDMLEVTQLVFDSLEFDGRSVTVLTASSSREARAIVDRVQDIAVAYVGVVMETEHAGLDFVRHVREDLGNHHMRLILRTGNPGAASREHVVHELEIDDYREKPELTADRLETSLLTSLRAYRRLCECCGSPGRCRLGPTDS